VSCTAATRCTAVGYDDTGEGTVGVGSPVVERLGGGAWRRQRTPDLTYRDDPWGGGGWLQAVSCPSPQSCVAVGGTHSAILGRPLAERWTGRRWTVDAMARPALQGSLIGVSCLTASRCTAVGYQGASGSDTNAPLIETTVTARPVPSGGGLG
jgi:hypothetical protein